MVPPTKQKSAEMDVGGLDPQSETAWVHKPFSGVEIISNGSKSERGGMGDFSSINITNGS